MLVNAFETELDVAADESLLLQGEHPISVRDEILCPAEPVVADIGGVLDAFVDDAFLGVAVGFVANVRSEIVCIDALGETYVGPVIAAAADGEIVHI